MEFDFPGIRPCADCRRGIGSYPLDVADVGIPYRVVLQAYFNLVIGESNKWRLGTVAIEVAISRKSLSLVEVLIPRIMLPPAPVDKRARLEQINENGFWSELVGKVVRFRHPVAFWNAWTASNFNVCHPPASALGPDVGATVFVCPCKVAGLGLENDYHLCHAAVFPACKLQPHERKSVFGCLAAWQKIPVLAGGMRNRLAVFVPSVCIKATGKLFFRFLVLGPHAG